MKIPYIINNSNCYYFEDAIETAKTSRLTRQRQVILEELRKVKSHPTADGLYVMVRKRLPHISLGTVYRNLDRLADQGLIKKISGPGKRMHFDGNTDEHVHIQCIICGRVDDLDVQANVSFNDSTSGRGYKILKFELEFYGICPQCSKKTDDHKRGVKNES